LDVGFSRGRSRRPLKYASQGDINGGETRIGAISNPPFKRVHSAQAGRQKYMMGEIRLEEEKFRLGMRGDNSLISAGERDEPV